MKSEKKRLTFKRVLCALLACATLAAATGCNGASQSSQSSQSSESQSTTAGGSSQQATSSGAPAESEAPAAANTAEAVGFEAVIVPFPDEPLMKYPVENGGKISMWISMNSTSAKYYQTLAESPTTKQVVQDTGIEIEFVHPPAGQEKENFNLLVVSDSLPDAVVNGVTHYAGGDVAAVEEGVFADINDLVSQYAPDYHYFLKKNDLFRKLATTTTGEVYSIYNYKDVQEPYYQRPQFRADWLEEWGMEIPFLLEEYEAYFEKVLAEKPGVAPFLPVKSGLENELLGTFEIGCADNGARFFVKDGTVHHTFSEPGLKDYLTMMNSWYQKGYISKDFTTTDRIDNEFANGKTAFVFGLSGTVYTLSKELGYKVVSGRYPRRTPDQQYHADIFYFPQNGTPTSISAKSNNKELALQFLNYGFTHQGSGVVNFGETGKTWTMGGGGIPQFTDYALHNTEFPLSDAEYTLRMHTMWTKYRYGDDVSMIRNVAEPDTWAYREKWGDDETSDSDWALPTLSFTPDAATEIGKLMTDINTYAEEMVLKFITGAAPLSEFDAFSQNVKALGIERVLELYQEAYEAFLAK